MDAKQAVAVAKAQVVDLFGDQLRSQPLLEELEFDDAAGAWLITIGFLREPQITSAEKATPMQAWSGLMDVPRQIFKVVRIDDGTGRVVSVKDRELAS